MIELKYASEYVNITMSFDNKEKTWEDCILQFVGFLQATGYVIDTCDLEEMVNGH